MSSPNEAGRGSGTAADTSAKAISTPDPDAERKPEAPTQLRPESWKYIFKRSLREFSREKCTDLAAALTHFSMLSLFPALLALVSLLGLVGQAQSTTQTMMQVIEGVASSEVADTLRQPIGQLAGAPSAGFAFVAGLLGALWSASGYVGAFGRALNQIYDVQEGRPFYKLKPLMLLLTLVLLIIVVVMAIMLVVSGPLARTLGDVVGLGETALTVWNIAKWPVLVVFAVVLIAVLYHGTPNVKQPKFRWLSPGSLIALIILAIATLGFFFYISNFGNYNKTYGAIGGVIVMLLWIWIANLSLLFGAVFNAEMERGRELQGGIEAEESLQLPPRDTTASDKLQKQEDKDVRDGRDLRRDMERGTNHPSDSTDSQEPQGDN